MNTSAAPANVRASVRRYPCARCGRHQTANEMIYSRWTRNRCANVAKCAKRARRRDQGGAS